jgi:hypothetical protein
LKGAALEMIKIAEVLLCGAFFAFVAIYLRQLVWYRAPFTAKLDVLINSCTIGVGFAVAMQFSLEWIGYSQRTFGLLSVWGLLTLLGVGYRASRVDWANKAKQTSTVAATSYVGVIMNIYLL